MKRVLGITMDRLRFHSAEAPTTARAPEDDELANGFLYDMDDLYQVLRAKHEQPQRGVASGEEIESEDGEFAARRITLRELLPTIVAVGRRLEQIRSAELERWSRELRGLDPVQRRAVEALTRGILNKIVHGPVCELRAHAGAPEEHLLAQLVRGIFGAT